MSRLNPNNVPDSNGCAGNTDHRGLTKTSDVHHPLSARNGQAWVLRLGEFPAEPLYTLIADGETIGSFDTWPTAWTRPTA